MLSHVYRIIRDFERSHGMRPNCIYLNEAHLQQLRQAFADPGDTEVMARVLDMAVVVDPQAVHPHVAWMPTRSRAV